MQKKFYHYDKKNTAISKIVYLALITNLPKVIVEELQKIEKKFLWQYSCPKIKHKTLSNTFKTGGLKNVDINLKVISLQCSWVKKLYDENFHEWKVISLHLICIAFGQKFKFHSNLPYDAKLLTSCTKGNTLLFLQSCLPLFYPLFYGIIKIS